MKHQIHFGKKFYQDKQKGYWISTTSPRIRAHVWVWINHNPSIPNDYHIHHKDKDKSNNCIENLELIHKSKHLSIHMSEPERREFSKKIADKHRPLTKAWHASEEGREWHRQHAISHDFGNGPLHDYVCLVCDKPYQSKLVAKDRSKFCSNTCKSQYRRDANFDNEERKCQVCDKIYSINKYRKTKTCSRQCGTKQAWELRKSKVDKKD